MTFPATPFNLALHEHLTALGYSWVQHEETWEDVGDAENGPELTGGPAFDEYTGPDEIVCASASGDVGREARNLEAEAYWAGQDR